MIRRMLAMLGITEPESPSPSGNLDEEARIEASIIIHKREAERREFLEERGIDLASQVDIEDKFERKKEPKARGGYKTRQESAGLLDYVKNHIFAWIIAGVITGFIVLWYPSYFQYIWYFILVVTGVSLSELQDLIVAGAWSEGVIVLANKLDQFFSKRKRKPKIIPMEDEEPLPNPIGGVSDKGSSEGDGSAKQV